MSNQRLDVRNRKAISIIECFHSYIEHISFNMFSGDGEIRTLDPLLARQVLSQLSYAPILVYMLLEAYI